MLAALPRLPTSPSPVVAQTSRSPRQVQLRRLLRGCEVVTFGEADAHRAGALLAKSRTTDVVDAAVVVLALERGAEIQTADASDIRRLTGAARAKLVIRDGRAWGTRSRSLPHDLSKRGS
jgi:hypothetical protein